MFAHVLFGMMLGIHAVVYVLSGCFVRWPFCSGLCSGLVRVVPIVFVSFSLARSDLMCYVFYATRYVLF